MYHQMKRRRLQLLNQFPELAEANELKLFLTSEGVVSDVRKMNREDTELKEDENLYSDSDEDDELNSEDFEPPNLNE